MRPEQIHITSKMLTTEHLLAYLHRELSEEDMHKVEEIVSEDEFYRDALEGLRLTTASSASKRIERINMDVEMIAGVKKTGRIVQISPVRAFSIAVAVIIFLAAGVVFMIEFQQLKKQNTGIAYEKETQIKSADHSVTLPSDQKKNDQAVTGSDTSYFNGLSGDKSEIRQEENNESPVVANTKSGEDAETKSTAVITVDGATDQLDIQQGPASNADMSTAPALAEQTVVSEKVIADRSSEGKKDKRLFKNKDEDKKESSKSNQDTETPSVTTGSYAGNIAIDETTGGKMDSVQAFTGRDDFSISLPTFPGGDDSLYRFISNNFHIPEGYEKYAGKIYIQFTVKTDGSISDIKIVRGINDVLDKEAMRVISIMPLWNGVSSDVIMTLPITIGNQK